MNFIIFYTVYYFIILSFIKFINLTNKNFIKNFYNEIFYLMK